MLKLRLNWLGLDWLKKQSWLKSQRRVPMNKSGQSPTEAKQRRVAVPTNKEERASDACESVSRQVTD